MSGRDVLSLVRAMDSIRPAVEIDHRLRVFSSGADRPDGRRQEDQTMNKERRFSRRPFLAVSIPAALLALAGMLAFAGPAFGDLSLISTTPADGDVGVDTLLTLIMQFSGALDTTARFDEPGGLFLGLEAYPLEAVGAPQGEITLSPDLTTVTIEDLPLEADRAYLFLLTGARSALGEMLDRPYVLIFSTGSALPQGSVSGTISFSGGDPGGAAIGLFKEPPFGLSEEDDSMPDVWGGGVVPLAGSTYTAPYVPAGSYYVIGFKDANHDGNLRFPGDAFGGYNDDGDIEADMITVAEGQDLTDIGLSISISPEVTAQENISLALGVAMNHHPDAQPSLVIGSPVTEIGTSENWQIGCYSEMADTLIGVTQVGGVYFTYRLPIHSDDGPEILYKYTLPDGWIDSDVAADTAEHYIGEQFRAIYNDIEVTAFATTFYFTEGKGSWPEMLWPAGLSSGRPATGSVEVHTTNQWAVVSVDEPELPPFRPAQTDTFIAWVFSYQSEAGDDDAAILIDILTGMPIGFPGPGAPTFARDNLSTAETAAAGWASDAVLVTVGNADHLSPDGSAWAWGYGYYSPGKDSVLVLFIVSDIITSQEAESTDVVPSLTPLPPGWLDSPAVTAVAEAASGNFRSQHSDAWVTTQVAYGLRPGEPSRAVWRFIYQSTLDDVWLFIYVDALTGEIVTAVEEAGDPGTLPDAFSLEPNYPNPFNAETVIGYALPREAHVEVAIYNVAGQRVRTLVDGIRPAGHHRVRWDGAGEDGRALASGLYVCRMRAGGFTGTRKMILLR